MLVACVVNIVGDLALVAGLGMDAAGAAIATVLAQAVSVVLAVVLLLKKHLPFTLRRTDFRPNPQCRKVLDAGLPLALQECLTQVSFLALCAFVNRLGLEASSGYGVACKIVNFAMLIPSALMQSMASFVSQNIGAGKEKRAKQAMFTGIGVGLACGCLVFILVLLKGDVLAGCFSPDAAVVQKGFDYLKGFAPETIATAVLFSMIGYFNGTNHTLWVMVQGIVQTLLVRLPLAYVMSIQPNASLTKIGMAAPVSTAVGNGDDGFAPGQFRNGLGNGNALLFAAGKASAALPHHGVVPVGQGYDEIVTPGLFRCGDHLRLAGIRLAEADVGPDGIVEQVHVLEHHGDVGKQAVAGEFPEVMAPQGDGAALGIVKPGQQAADGGLAAAGGAHDGGGVVFHVSQRGVKKAVRQPQAQSLQNGVGHGVGRAGG